MNYLNFIHLFIDFDLTCFVLLMTFKDEEIINEFVKAYHEKDYPKVAEMLRFIRSEGKKKR